MPWPLVVACTHYHVHPYTSCYGRRRRKILLSMLEFFSFYILSNFNGLKTLTLFSAYSGVPLIQWTLTWTAGFLMSIIILWSFNKHIMIYIKYACRGTLVYILICRTFVDSAQNFTLDYHSSMWWSCSFMLNLASVHEQALSLYTTISVLVDCGKHTHLYIT